MPNIYEGNQQLVDALRKGHKDAITEIYRTYGQSVLMVAYRHLKDKAEAEKIVLKILTNLWDQRDHLEINSLTDCLDTALKNALLQAIYQKKQTDKTYQDIIRPKATVNS